MQSLDVTLNLRKQCQGHEEHKPHAHSQHPDLKTDSSFFFNLIKNLSSCIPNLSIPPPSHPRLIKFNTIIMPTFFHTLDTKDTTATSRPVAYIHFSLFNCCSSVVLGKGADPDNSRVLCCLIKYVFFLTVHVFGFHFLATLASHTCYGSFWFFSAVVRQCSMFQYLQKQL